MTSVVAILCLAHVSLRSRSDIDFQYKNIRKRLLFKNNPQCSYINFQIQKNQTIILKIQKINS